jgi:hypothetical protein
VEDMGEGMVPRERGGVLDIALMESDLRRRKLRMVGLKKTGIACKDR